MSTIKDIAQYVGVSVATVSNALNGHANVSDSVRQRVLDAAETLQYVPNINAKLMRGRKTNNIGLFLPYLHGTFYQNLIQEIYSACLKNGYSLLIHISRDISGRDLLSNILSSNIDAAIILSDRFPDELIPKLQEKNVPVVFLDREIASSNVGSVIIDEGQGMCQSVAYLANTGHKVIGHLFGIIETYSARPKLDAFRRAMHNAGLPVYEELLQDDHYNQYASYSAVRSLLTRNPTLMPDAFVCADDDTAIGCIRALQDMGYRVPHDVSVTGCSSIPSTTDQHLPITRAHYSMTDLAHAAVHMVLSMLKDHTPGTHLSIGTTFLVGETTRLRNAEL